MNGVNTDGRKPGLIRG